MHGRVFFYIGVGALLRLAGEHLVKFYFFTEWLAG